jgi:hypothetical protein
MEIIENHRMSMHPYLNIDQLETKHSKYYASHVPNETFYGLGIENETYIMFDKHIPWKGKNIKNKQRRERYSVDYFSNFSSEIINDFNGELINDETYHVPLFMNSHTLTKCDKNGEHKTNYSLKSEQNKKFNGTTIDELMKKKSMFFRDNYDKMFVYDGDTIEIMTTNFYCATVDDVVGELTANKNNLINEIRKVFDEENIFKKYGDIHFQDNNYGIVSFMSNINNVSVCNNGTYHVNITLPTKLDNNCFIDDFDLFKKTHANAIRAIQWFEPLIISCYGSPDIFSCTNEENNTVDKKRIAMGSLRLALSRYISIGTYNTNNMVSGKLLDTLEYDDGHWYNQFHNGNKKSVYKQLKTIGYDINFNKFKNHGIELRIFDYFPEKYLTDVINILLLLCELSMHRYIPNPLSNKYKNVYNNMIIECVSNGFTSSISKKYMNAINEIFLSEKGVTNDRQNGYIYGMNKMINRLQNKLLSIFSFDDANDFDESSNSNDSNNSNDSHYSNNSNDEINKQCEMKDVKNKNNVNINVTIYFQKVIDNIYNNVMKMTNDDDYIHKVSPNMRKPIIHNHNKDMYEINKRLFSSKTYK